MLIVEEFVKARSFRIYFEASLITPVIARQALYCSNCGFWKNNVKNVVSTVIYSVTVIKVRGLINVFI